MAFVKEEVVLSIEPDEFVPFKGVVVLIGEFVCGMGSGIDWFAGHIVTTGICKTVVGKILVAFAIDALGRLSPGSIVAADSGADVTIPPGVKGIVGNTSMGYGTSGIEVVCIPAKGAGRISCRGAYSCS